MVRKKTREHPYPDHATAWVTSLLGTLAILSFVSCAPLKTLEAPAKPDLVWYRQDASEAFTKSDLETCGSTPSPAKPLAACMQAKGYLLIDRPVAELLQVQTLKDKGLPVGTIADRLQLSKKKVETYLDEGYQLPESPALGRLPVEILTKVGKPAVNPLIEALASDELLVRRQAVDALGRIGDPRAVDPLLATLNDQDSLVRGHAIEALGRIKDPRAVPPLIALLSAKDEQPHVRMSAAEALGTMKDKRALEPLVLALLDEHWGVRSRAVQALGQLGNPRAVGCLIGALQDKEPAVRGHAAQALGIMSDGRAVKPLTAALEDPDREVRKKAALALRRLTGTEFKVR